MKDLYLQGEYNLLKQSTKSRKTKKSIKKIAKNYKLHLIVFT